MTRPYFSDPDFVGKLLPRIKLGRIGQVDDLTGAVVFLASGASALMTGSAVVDGGYTTR